MSLDKPARKIGSRCTILILSINDAPWTKVTKPGPRDDGTRASWPLDPGWVKKIKIRIRDEHPGSYFRELRNNFSGKNTYLNSLMRIRIRESFWPGWKKFGSGINIPDSQHCWKLYRTWGAETWRRWDPRWGGRWCRPWAGSRCPGASPRHPAACTAGPDQQISRYRH